MSAVPTIYFIDDSATMREVIKIAFRRENMNVVAAQDAVMALAEIETTHPDIVITDVIMPDKDGYEVCQFIKNHPELSQTPVILMSGVVNRAVAERAFAVKADELLRKPFQPQDLIARVRHLLNPNEAPTPSPAAAANAAAALSSIFAASPVAPRSTVPAGNPRPAALAAPATQGNGHARPFQGGPVAAPVKSGGAGDPARLRIEVLRLEGLVKKLQSELEAEREYSRALEAHVKTLQESETS
ncbi:MAG TPA: response regulator [Candidatus Limnocylindrales bacterium]|nr:response regulator [Candidatus Limnocylindrales bacterium]